MSHCSRFSARTAATASPTASNSSAWIARHNQELRGHNSETSATATYCDLVSWVGNSFTNSMPYDLPAVAENDSFRPCDGVHRKCPENGASKRTGSRQVFGQPSRRRKHPVGAGLYARVLNSSWRSRLSAGHGTFMVVFACSSILFSATNTSRETVT